MARRDKLPAQLRPDLDVVRRLGRDRKRRGDSYITVPVTTDGPRAPHRYQIVEASTGFSPPEDDPADLPDEARRLAERCRPYYERLVAHRVGR